MRSHPEMKPVHTNRFIRSAYPPSITGATLPKPKVPQGKGEFSGSIVPRLLNLEKHLPRAALPLPLNFEKFLPHTKVASGHAIKDHQANEIDSPDVSNLPAPLEYADDLYQFYKQEELARRPINYTENTFTITAEMRTILVGWLIAAHREFIDLPPESLYLAVYILDRYLSLEFVPREAREVFLLIGVGAFVIALKFEEDWVPKVHRLIRKTGNRFSNNFVAWIEKEILNKLDWYLTVPTAYMFLVRFIKAAKADKELEHMINFYAELALMDHTLINAYPSMVAASAVYAARCTLRRCPLWPDALRENTSYRVPQLLNFAYKLVTAHTIAPFSIYKRVVYEKYMHQEFDRVACYKPATRQQLF